MSSTENTDTQSFKNRFSRFLSTAGQAALNASAVISNQIYHNINPTRSLSLSAVPRSHNYTSSISGTQSKSVRTRSYSALTKTQVESQPEVGFDAFLLCQGPRALDIATVEEYKEHYDKEIEWRQEMGALDVQGEEMSPKSTNVTQTHSVFERSVEKRVGTEELRRDWIQFCSKHGSRGAHQSSQSPCSFLLPPCDLSTVEEDDHENSSASNTEFLPDWQPLSLPQPIEPSEHVTPFSIQLNDTGNILDDASSLVSPDPDYPSTLSSNSYLGTPSFPRDNLLPSPVSPSPEPFYISAVKKVEEKKTAYFALYPSDHRLGFNCVCETCRLKEIKKLKPDTVPTLAERRTAKRAAMETPPTPTSPQDTNYTFSDFSAPVPPCEPVGYFMSGNTMVPAYSYKDQLYNVAPSTYMLGNHIVYSVGSGGKARPNRKRGRGAETSSTEDEVAFEEEHGESRRKRRK